METIVLAGGSEQDAHYQLVAGCTTGHSEAVKVTFDTTVVSPKDILIFFGLYMTLPH